MIDLKRHTFQQDALLRDLFVLHQGAMVRSQAHALLASEPNIALAMKDAKPSTGAFRWLFSSGAKKETAIRAGSYLAYLARGQFGSEASRIINSYNQVVNAAPLAAYEDFEHNSVVYYTLLEGLGLVTSKPLASGLPAELVAQIEQYPLDLVHMKTQLRQYQTFGTKYVLNQGMTLLGDEMGLGKTIQALAAIADLKVKGETHFLVVCPASVLVNWKREIEKHTGLQSIIIHGFDKTEELDQWKSQGDVGITNYESLLGLAPLIDFDFGILVVDEAHFVKNPQAQRTKALTTAAQRAHKVLYMTGTPLENRVDEMCFLVGCLSPAIADKLSGMRNLSSTSAFKEELAPVYLRRVREDVLSELPDLIENEDWLEPTRTELQAYYQAVQSGNFMAMRRISWDVEAAASTKAQRLLEICEESKDEGRKVIVFSFFRDTLARVCAMLGDQAIGPITGETSMTNRQALIDEYTQAEEGKVLVAQVQAGGVGLNIQAASVIVFTEPQIKPSLENQAISRAYRMGQVRDVQVHRLLCEGSIDERMMEILSTKQTEFDTYAEESVVGTESLKAQGESAWIKELIAQEKARVDSLLAN